MKTLKFIISLSLCVCIKSQCIKEWANCQNSTECCPINGPKQMTCYRRDVSWTYGVCKPPKTDMNGTCYDLDVNTCESNEECCSKNCYGLDQGWMYGICNKSKPESTKPISLAWIIASSVGILVVFILIGVLIVVILCCRRKNSMVKRPEIDDMKNELEELFKNVNSRKSFDQL